MSRKRSLKAIGSALLVAVVALSGAVYAQMGGGMMQGDQGGPGMQQMSGMMHDMGDQMMKMSDMMSKGDMNADMQKRMSERMREMAGMMGNMSGMMGKGMMMDSGMQKQMGDMRGRMDGMMKQPMGTGGSR
jgi:hypothetical protein